MKIRSILCVLSFIFIFSCSSTKPVGNDSLPVNVEAKVENIPIKTETKKSTEEVLVDYLKSHPDDPNAKVALAMIAVSKGETDNAISILKEVLQKDAKNLDAIDLMIAVFYNQNKFDLAKSAVQKALGIDENDVTANAYMGRLLMKEKKSQEALKYFEKSIFFGNDDPYVFADRGAAYSDNARMSEAVEDFTQAINKLPTETFLYLDRGRAYIRDGDFDLAIKDFTFFLSKESNAGLALAYRGQAYYLKGDFENALKDLEKTKSLKQDYSPINEALATSYAAKGNIAKSFPLYNAIFDPVFKNYEILLFGPAWAFLSGDKEAIKTAIGQTNSIIQKIPQDNILYQIAQSYIDSKQETIMLTKIKQLPPGLERGLAEILAASSLYRSGQKDTAYILAKSAFGYLSPNTTPWFLAKKILNEQN